MSKDRGLTRTIASHVTTEEYDRIRAYAEAQNGDVSTLTRELWLRELDRGSRDVPKMHLEIFVRTVEAWLESSDRFNVEKFREICGSVVAKSAAPESLKRNGTTTHAQA